MRIKKEPMNLTVEKLDPSVNDNEGSKKYAEELENYLVKKGIPSDSFLIEYYLGPEIIGKRDNEVRLTPQSEDFWLHFGSNIKDPKALSWYFEVTLPRMSFRVRDSSMGGATYWSDDISSKPLTFYNRLKTWADRRIFK